ncbi:MAG TPA: 4'-phosphopantetheinyl transferase superfamily protein [Candidatus Binatia bacterium]|nr:4'-phosphopantetheinyl transferase superfamily protein [Candidatus Binatia bacterium]
MPNPFLVRPNLASGRVLRENEVHIWLVQTNDESISLRDSEDLLSSVEQDQASKFKFEVDRRRYVAAHAALRSIVSIYVNSPARELQFASGPYGKPKLAPIHIKKKFEFNLSHSHELALIAVTRGREIGVDVEWIKKDFAFDEVAQRFFTTREVAALHALPLRLQREAFYKCWTSKEAFLKAKGTGLSGQLDEVEIVFIDDVVRVKGTIPNFSLIEITIDGGYTAALVVGGVEPRLTYYAWEWRSQ